MEIARFLLAALSGTVLMTTFSFAMSAAFNKLFKEPVLLNYMMELLGMDLPGNKRSFVGYVVHYLFGILFVAGYELLWHFSDWRPTWDFALLFGMASGIVGILGWMIIFRLPRKEPRVSFGEYYLQLFFAHIFFALGVVAIYKLWP